MAFFRRVSIRRTAEFERIYNLPRREWRDDQMRACATHYTNKLRTPYGTMSLRPLQAVALHEIGQCGGGVFPLRVGGGKTLLSLLASQMLPNIRRPILILPAALVTKTRDEWSKLAMHWQIHTHIQIQSYETLGRENAARWLEQQSPDLIICDEAHRLKNKQAGVTRRVSRYMHSHPQTHFIAMSGTLLKENIEDFAHLMQWALKDGAPVPHERGELSEWAECLGVQKNPLVVWEPGPLALFARQEDLDDTDPKGSARRAFRRRLRETAGVVASGDENVACSLYVRAVSFTPNAVTESNFETLRQAWETPDGWALGDAVSVWRHARELALGFHGVWDPRPPQDWLDARRDWASHVRTTLTKYRSGEYGDTEKTVRNAVENGELDGIEILRTWQRIEPTFLVQPKDIWHDTTALEYCAKWAKEAPGIIWTDHVFFARELARITGLHYYGEQGVSELDGTTIEQANPKKSCIASRAANSTGRNLQAWHRNLITSCPSGGDAMEQLLGRTHRDGQTADTVTADVLMICREHFEAFERAKERSGVKMDVMGGVEKLSLADIDMPSRVAVENAARQFVRWDRSGG